MVEVMKIMVTPFKRSHHALLHSVPPTLQQATTDPCLHLDSWTLTGKSGSVSCGVTAPFSWVLACMHKLLFVSSKSLFPQSCVSSGVSVVELKVTQVCFTQSPCPCSTPLLTRTTTGDTQTQFCLSLCGDSGS